jgi:chromosome partitioning protein
MGTLDKHMSTQLPRENILKHILTPVVQAGLYDYIIIDTNPNLSILNFNVVNASDYALIPVQLASFDLEGIGTLVDFIKGIQKFNTKLEILGIVINKYDIRNKNITNQAEEQLRAAYNDLIFKTIIKIDVKIQNAQWENKPVMTFDTNSRISKEYRELAKEVTKRC